MDIIDILIAKSITPQGQMEGALVAAQQAARDALAAKAGAIEAQDYAETAEGNAQTYATNAQNSANSAAFYASQSESASTITVDGLYFNIDRVHEPEGQNIDPDDNYYSWSVFVSYPSGKTSELEDLVKLYNTVGNNIDASMTQKAITTYINHIESEIWDLDRRTTYLEEHGTGGGGDIPVFEPTDQGRILTIDSDGRVIVSDIYEEDIIKGLIASGVYENDRIVGVEIDYVNKTSTRIQGARGLNAGWEFDGWHMFSGRTRYIVDNDGQIVEQDDGFNNDIINAAGRNNTNSIMVVQPKFYYMRVPIETIENSLGGKTILKEQILLSDIPASGFKLHPAFIDENGNELEYIMFGAFEGNNATDQYDETISDNDFANPNNFLQSMTSVKPITGENKNFTVARAEQLAQNRGPQWHITDMTVESCNQMLMAVEFGGLNIQAQMGVPGLVNLPTISGKNSSAQTGSTIDLHSFSGAATETTVVINGNSTTYNEEGKVASAYRGMENPWGNTWRMVGNAQITSSGGATGGFLNIKMPGNSEYYNTGICIPNTYDWITGFNYIPEYDWLFIPSASNGGTSAAPVGDNFWTTPNNRQTNKVLVGGAWSFGDVCGPFCYAFDTRDNAYSHACNARLMLIPDITSEAYQYNIENYLAGK